MKGQGGGQSGSGDPDMMMMRQMMQSPNDMRMMQMMQKMMANPGMMEMMSGGGGIGEGKWIHGQWVPAGTNTTDWSGWSNVREEFSKGKGKGKGKPGDWYCTD